MFTAGTEVEVKKIVVRKGLRGGYQAYIVNGYSTNGARKSIRGAMGDAKKLVAHFALRGQKAEIVDMTSAS